MAGDEGLWTRRALLAAGAVVLSKPAAHAVEAVQAADEPHHHLVFQNGVLRLERVLLRPGEATGWFTSHLGRASVALGAAQIRQDAGGEGASLDLSAGSVRFDDPVGSLHRLSNAGQTLYHAIDLELLRGEPGHFGKADRSAAPSFSRVLDKPLVRAWRLALAPGEATPVYRQDGPGLRVLLGGDRLIDTKPGEIGHESEIRPGEALFMLPAARSITNAGGVPLDLIEIELL